MPISEPILVPDRSRRTCGSKSSTAICESRSSTRRSPRRSLCVAKGDSKQLSSLQPTSCLPPESRHDNTGRSTSLSHRVRARPALSTSSQTTVGCRAGRPPRPGTGSAAWTHSCAGRRGGDLARRRCFRDHRFRGWRNTDRTQRSDLDPRTPGHRAVTHWCSSETYRRDRSGCISRLAPGFS
jgi:hypothetical protein